MGIRRKLKSRRGESLAEVLVAVLVAAIAITMFVGMVSAAIRVTKKNRDALDSYYKRNNLLVQYSDGGGAVAGVTSERGTVTLEGALKKEGVPENVEGVSVTYYINTTGNQQVIVYTEDAGVTP